ncbi:kinase [Nocardia sp. NPDC058176]|uniref:kinase n=1 Tax=Nocardia sp. NPDC058176 TaxID=3346368 RepID=UPI0036D9FCF0
MTAALAAQDSRFRLFERLKAGTGRTVGYRLTGSRELDRLAEAGEVVWENARYGARYVIDRPTLREHVAAGAVPVVHAGQPEVVDAVRTAIPDTVWFIVELRLSREVARARIVARATGDTAERLTAWDATPPLSTAMLSIDSGQVAAARSAAIIRALIDLPSEL